MFAKKIVQVRTRFGPILAPVKHRVRSQLPPQNGNVHSDSLQTNALSNDIPATSLHSQMSIPQHEDKSSLSSSDQMLQSVNRSIQEVAMDRNNVEHQDIVQQALGIVKLADDPHATGPYGDVNTTIANTLSETIHLATSLASETMSAAGQFGTNQIGDDLSLAVPIESTMNPSVTEGLTLTPTQAQSLLAHMDTSNFPSVTNSGAMITNQQDILNSVTTEPQLLTQTSESQVVGVVKNALQGVVNDMMHEVSSAPIQPKVEEPLASNPADQPFVIKVCLYFMVITCFLLRCAYIL